MKASRSEFVEIRGLRHHIRRWGSLGSPKLFMLHGWMDMSATFQFLVNELEGDWDIIAPDWSGFGLSDWSSGGYSLLHYCAFLDAMLQLYSPDEPVRVVAHSMGANISNLYFGARPKRLLRFVNIEGYAPIPGFFEGSLGSNIARWLDHAHQPSATRSYPSYAELAHRLRESNSRLSPERAEFLASHLGIRRENGQIEVAADPGARFVSPVSLHRDQAMELWREIDAPVLCIRGERSFVSRAFEGCAADLDERLACLSNGREELIPNGTHNLHHEQPELLARLIEPFLSSAPASSAC